MIHNQRLQESQTPTLFLFYGEISITMQQIDIIYKSIVTIFIVKITFKST